MNVFALLCTGDGLVRLSLHCMLDFWHCVAHGPVKGIIVLIIQMCCLVQQSILPLVSIL